MKPERMRIKIAEACGWKLHGAINGVLLMFPPNGGDAWCPPNYPESHDAMAEAIGTLSMDELDHMAAEIMRMDSPVGLRLSHIILRTTPLQHAEAFLRAKGLWEDGE